MVTLFSAARLGHALNQMAALRGSGVRHVGVWLDEAEAPTIEGVTGIHVPPGAAGMRLAAGRNAGARAAIDAGAELLVFLDADCLPGPELLRLYGAAAAQLPGAVLCGPVTYLAEGFQGQTPDELAVATAPHPARPNPAAGECVVAPAGQHALFWSLSFAVTPATWMLSGGFSELYEGYGAEDTDFAARLGPAGLDLVWVGGAHAYHQYHPTSTPPWQHLDDILRNAGIFWQRWGWWPMQGWLDAFAAAGAIELVDGVWRRVVEDASDAPESSESSAAGTRQGLGLGIGPT
ncbi:glycosyltransferase family 2 protein [Subtercola vilae]|nr:galactosyltransferase-related protein [Subtercola vilae]